MLFVEIVYLCNLMIAGLYNENERSLSTNNTQSPVSSANQSVNDNDTHTSNDLNSSGTTKKEPTIPGRLLNSSFP